MPQIFLNSNILRLHMNFIKFAEIVGDVSPAYKRFIPEFQKSREGWIYAGRDVDGKRFTPLSPRYRKRKEAIYGSQPIMIASGVLINAIRGGQGWSQKITSKSLHMEIDLPYASVHQGGYLKRNIPQRAYFLTKNGTLNKMDYAQLIQSIEGEIEETTKAVFNKSIVEMAIGK